MGEIKFRVWDKQDFNMYDVASIDFEGAEIGIYNQLGKVDVFPWDDRLVLRRYISLHDKDGKEIYEGDVLKMPGISNKTVQLEKYDYDTGSCYGFDLWCACNGTVIGNIYENPELLNSYPDTFTSEKEEETREQI